MTAQPVRRPSGFTLLELIVVIAIIGTLSAIVTMKMVDVPDRARVTAATAEMDCIVRAAKMERIETGRWPESIRELVELDRLEEYPKDPWGGEYLYELDDGVVVTCYGADGEVGGSGYDADLVRPEREV